MSTREVRTKNGKKRISQEVKMEIVREYYLEGQHNQSALARKYGIGMVTVHDILRNFAAENDKSALLMGKKVKTSESEEIKALRKEVWDLKKNSITRKCVRIFMTRWSTWRRRCLESRYEKKPTPDSRKAARRRVKIRCESTLCTGRCDTTGLLQAGRGPAVPPTGTGTVCCPVYS